MADVEFYGTNPRGHHLTNVAIHSAASCLLLCLLLTMTGAFWPGSLVACLFALHHLHVESAAWVAQRKDVLSGFFFFPHPASVRPVTLPVVLLRDILQLRGSNAPWKVQKRRHRRLREKMLRG